MYDYIKGLPTDKRKTDRGTFVTIDVVGLGYLLEVTERDFVSFSISDTESVKYYVSLIHREDAMNMTKMHLESL